MARTTHIRGPAKDGGEHDWEAHDAMHTLLRAGEIVKNKTLLSRVRKRAKAHSEKSAAIAKQASVLARTGHISPKQMAKLASR